MKCYRQIRIAVITLIAALTMPLGLAAQDNTAQAKTAQHHHYKLIDIGTFGGPNDQGSVSGSGNYLINNGGSVAGSADTLTPDPFPNFCFFSDCLVAHVFRWQDGVLTDLGALVRGVSSATCQVNARGWIAGQSQNGVVDPLIGIPEIRAVLWKNGNIPIDLGTLGGNESTTITLNNAGQVVGAAANTILDPLSLFGFGTQTRAFLWQNEAIQDLGTLGGPDAAAVAVNGPGQVAGFSYTDATPTPVTGLPTTHPFLWQKGNMIDLGTLGGTYGGPGFNVGLDTGLAMNNRGQVVGTSTLAGDLIAHPFLWANGTLTDLGTFGGDNGGATWINDAGDVVGEADLPGSVIHHGFLWREGVMTDLGSLGSTSFAGAINSRGQVIGRSRIGGPTNPLQHAFLWEKSGPMIDLNTLIPANSGVLLGDACCINDRGEIVAFGTLTNGNVHDFLLIPCDDDHPSVEGCDYSMVDASAAQSNNSAARPLAETPQVTSSPKSTVNQIRNRWMQHFRLPTQRTTPQG